jgi:hypothetical protein
MGAALPGLKVGPLDPDSTAEFGRVSGRVSARQLVKRHAAAHPKDLVGQLTRAPDIEQSKALDIAEVTEAAANAGIPGEVVGAGVRGERDQPQIVAVTYRVESGRTAKAVLDFTEELLPVSFRAGQQAVKIAEAKENGQPWLPPDVIEALAGRAPAASAKASVSDEAVADLTREVGELRQMLEEAVSDDDDGEGRTISASVTYEPFEGYGDANVDEVKARIAEEPEGFEREYLKRQVREAEEARDDPRSGVLKATEPIELVPAPASD